MADALLRVRITGDVARLERGLDSASRKLGAFGDRASKVGGQLTTRLTLPIVGLGAVAIKAAGDLNESISKVDSVFKQSAPEVQAWAKTTTEAFKISRQEALEAAGTFGNLFIALGTATPAAADMSRKMVELAGDLASFNNVSVEDALLALRSGLVGEAEPLRKFGVSLSETRIQAEAVAAGLVKLNQSTAAIELADREFANAQKDANKAIKRYGEDSKPALEAIIKMEAAQAKLDKALAGTKVELTAAQKAQAAYRIILKDTALAQGDAGRTGDQFAGQMRELKARFSDTAGELGTKLLPVATRFLTKMSELLDKFSGLSPRMQDFIIKGAAIAVVLGPAIKVTGGVAKGIGGIVTAAKKIGGVLGILKQGKDAICAPAGCADHLGGASGRAASKVGTLASAVGKRAVPALALYAVTAGSAAGSTRVLDGWVREMDKDLAKGSGTLQFWIGMLGNPNLSAAGRAAIEAAAGFDIFASSVTNAATRYAALDRIVANSTFNAGDPGGALRGDFPSGRGGGGGAARAAGGPVDAGRAYRVGEKGPELFVPHANGQIIPNQAMGGPSPAAIAAAVAAALAGMRWEVGDGFVRLVDRRQGSRSVALQRAG